MTNDQQQVEAWRKEHKDLLLATNIWCLANFQELEGSYYDWHLQASWEGFLLAKRNQPVIELPDGDSDGMVALGEVHTAITAAGHTYTVAK